MKTYIQLENIEIYAHHGVFEQETLVGNTFKINIKIRVDISAATHSDNLEDTLNYGEIYNLIEKEMGISSKLLEHVGGRIIRKLKTTYPLIEEIELEISKQNPPTGGKIDYASIILID